MNRMNDTTFFPKREDESTIQEQELTACARERLPKKNPWRHSKIWEQNSKRPLGLHDGLSAELYKAFWKDISAILIRALNRLSEKSFVLFFQYPPDVVRSAASRPKQRPLHQWPYCTLKFTRSTCRSTELRL